MLPHLTRQVPPRTGAAYAKAAELEPGGPCQESGDGLAGTARVGSVHKGRAVEAYFMAERHLSLFDHRAGNDANLYRDHLAECWKIDYALFQ